MYFLSSLFKFPPALPETKAVEKLPLETKQDDALKMPLFMIFKF